MSGGGKDENEKGVLSTEQQLQPSSHTVAQIEEKEDAISNYINGESDDDEFGDFEEVDQTNTTEETANKTFKSKENLLPPYDGHYQKNEDSITHLLHNIFGGIPSPKNSGAASDIDSTMQEKYTFSERASKVFEQLVSDEDKYATHIIWKKSMIFKQLMLNLDIPIESINQISGTVPHTGSTNSTTEFRDLYDRENTLNVNSELEKLLTQVPEFESLKIDKKTDEFNDRITNTTSVITDAHHLVKKQSEDDEKYLVELITVKKNLLELLSVWDERMGDIKADNELFSSYVENLIGNTQKFRRVSKIAK